MTTDEMNIGWTEFANATPIEDWEAHEFDDLGVFLSIAKSWAEQVLEFCHPHLQ